MCKVPVMIACLHIPDYPAWVMRYRYPNMAIAVFHQGRVLARTRQVRQRVGRSLLIIFVLP